MSAVLKVSLANGLALYAAMSFKTAKDWNLEKLNEKFKGIAKTLDTVAAGEGGFDGTFEDEKLKKLAKNIQKTLKAGGSVVAVGNDSDGEEAAPAVEEKAAKPAKAAKKAAPVEEEDEEDEAPAKPAKKTKAAPAAEEEEDEDEEPAPKPKKKATKAAAEEDDEDEEPAPKKGKKAAAAEEEEDEEDEDEKVPVKPAKKKKAVPPKRGPTLHYIAGQILKERDLAAPDAKMVKELNKRTGRNNDAESMFQIKKAWHAIRGFKGIANEGDDE